MDTQDNSIHRYRLSRLEEGALVAYAKSIRVVAVTVDLQCVRSAEPPTGPMLISQPAVSQ